MLKNIITISIITVASILAGCATTNATIIPHGKNGYTVVALSSSENYATKNAMAKASETCQTTGQQVNVTKQHSIYQGIDKSQKSVAGLAGDVLNVIAKGPASSHGEESADDYKVTLDFVCQ